MKGALLLLAVVLHAANAAYPISDACEAYAQGRCFKATKGSCAWPDANAECASVFSGGVLASPNGTYSLQSVQEYVSTNAIAPWIGYGAPDPSAPFNVDGSNTVYNAGAPAPNQAYYVDGNIVGIGNMPESRGGLCQSLPTRVVVFVTPASAGCGPPVGADSEFAARFRAAGWDVVWLCDSLINSNNPRRRSDAIVMTRNSTAGTIFNIAGARIPVIVTGTDGAGNLSLAMSSGCGIETNTYIDVVPGHPITDMINKTRLNVAAVTWKVPVGSGTVLLKTQYDHPVLTVWENGVPCGPPCPNGGLNPLRSRRILMPWAWDQLAGADYTTVIRPVFDAVINYVTPYTKVTGLAALPTYSAGATLPIVTVSVFDGNGVAMIGYQADIAITVEVNGVPERFPTGLKGGLNSPTLLCRTSNALETYAPGPVMQKLLYTSPQGEVTFDNLVIVRAGLITLRVKTMGCDVPFPIDYVSPAFQVNPGPYGGCTIEPSVSGTLPTGTPMNVTVCATDQYGNPDNYAGKTITAALFYGNGTQADDVFTVLTGADGCVTLAADMPSSLGSYYYATLTPYAYNSSGTFTIVPNDNDNVITLTVPTEVVPGGPVTLQGTTFSVTDHYGHPIDGGAQLDIVYNSTVVGLTSHFVTTSASVVAGQAVATQVTINSAWTGCYHIQATRNSGVLNTQDTYGAMYNMPDTYLFDQAVENTVVTSVVNGWMYGLEYTITSQTCEGNFSTAIKVANVQYTFTWLAQDYEAVGDSCYVEFVVNGCGTPYHYVLNVTNVYEFPVARNYTLTLPTQTLTTDVVLGKIVVSVIPGGPQNFATMTILTLPTSVLISLNGTTLTPSMLPYNTSWPRNFTLLYAAGAYTDSMTYMAWDILGNSSTVATITFVADTSCDDPNMVVSPSGKCVCTATYFLRYVQGNQTCVTCAAGTYYDGVDTCVACPDGALCTGGLAFPSAALGYYCPEDTNATVLHSGAYPKCAPQAACLGACKCRQGHHGDLCGQCDVQYYRENSLCQPCTGGAVYILLAVIVVLLIVMALLVKVARKSTTYFTSLSVGFNFLQVISVLAEFDLKWPPFVLSFYRALSVINFNFNIMQPECSVGSKASWYSIWIFTLILPVILMFLFLLAYFIGYVYKSLRDRFPYGCMAKLPLVSEISILVLRNSCINAFFAMCILLYLQLVSTALEIYQCDVDGNMIKDASYKCYTSGWYDLVYISVAATIVYGLGMPLGLFYLLYNRRKSLTKELVIIKYGLLYRRYKRELFAWEIIVLWRKVGIIIGVLLFAGRAVYVASVALAVLILSLGLNLYFRPYMSARVNFLETMNLVCSSIVIVCGFIFALVQENAGTNDTLYYLGVAVVVIVIVNCVAIAVVVFLELRYQVRLVSRGVQSRVASDDVLVNGFFFKEGFHVKEMSRNVMGTTSSIVLTSKTDCIIRVEYIGKRGQVLRGPEKVAAVQGLAQSDGHTHVIVSIFRELGRFGIRVYAVPRAEFEKDGTRKRKMLCGDTCKPLSELIYRRNDYQRITFQYSLNLDVKPLVFLNAPVISAFATQRKTVVMRPHFRQLTVGTQLHFEVRTTAIAVVLGVKRPQSILDSNSFPLERKDDNTFAAVLPLTQTGPIFLWCRFVLPKTKVGEDGFYQVNTAVENPVFGVLVNDDDSRAVVTTPDDADDDAGMADSLAKDGHYVRCATFMVLEREAGWTESGLQADEFLGVLVQAKKQDLEMNAVMGQPPLVRPAFTSNRGVVNLPLRRDVPVGISTQFDFILPLASHCVLNAYRPAKDFDGVPCTKRGENAWFASAAFPTAGRLLLWARFNNGMYQEMVEFNVM